MSGTGSLMIRNLRKPADLQKAYMVQDQLLKIAASNDANIANARRSLKQGEVLTQTEQQTATPDELQADVGKNESDAITNLLAMGFHYSQASAITTLLDHPQRVIFNNMFPDIKADFLKKFNITRTTPTAFVDYLRKYIESFNENKGLAVGGFNDKFDRIINNIADLRGIFPSRVELRQLITEVHALPLGFEIRADMAALMGALPDRAFFDALQIQNDAQRGAILAQLQNLTVNLPTNAQFLDAIRDINATHTTTQQKLDIIEGLMGGLNRNTIQKIDDLISGITGGAGGSPASASASIVPSASGNTITGVVGIANARYPLVGRGKTPATAGTTVIILIDSGNVELPITTAPLWSQFLKDNADVSRAINTVIGSITWSGVKDYIGDHGSPYGGPLIPASGGGKAAASAPSSPPSAGGKGGVGIRMKKIGKGISVEETPTYRQLGKYVIHQNQLQNSDILNVKYPSLGRIPQFKPTHINSSTKDFLMELLDNQRVNPHHYDTLPLQDRKLFEKIMTGAGVFHKLGLKKSVSDDERAEYDRFQVLKGEYMAGNNSVALMKELRRFIVKFMTEGKIHKSEGVDLLMDLSI